MPGYPVPWCCISITGPRDSDARVPEMNRVGILRLKFDDVTAQSNWGRDYVLFSPEQARQVLDFAKAMWPKASIIHIHCWAGISRSSGTAAALSKIYFGDDGKFVKTPNGFCPNSLVYRTILDVHAAELATAKLTRQQEVLKRRKVTPI